MRLVVKLFAGARELVGHEYIEVEIATASTVCELRKALETQHPALAPLLPYALFAGDASYATDQPPLTEHAEIACIPPVSGG